MRSLLLLCAAMLLVSAMQAQTPTEKSLLWEISGNGISSPSYLYGTYHMVCPESLNISDALKEKIGTAEQLYLEIDMSDASLQAQMMSLMMMHGDSVLPQFFSAEEYEVLNKDFQALTGMPLNQLERLKPMLVSAMVLPVLMACSVQSVEGELIKLSQANGIPLKGLETVADQMAVFDVIPYSVQASQLRKGLADIDSMRRTLDMLKTTYDDQDVAGLYDLTTKDPDMAEFMDVLLINRNKNWIPVIETEVKEKPTFFGVGAGHLGGDEGVISLLRNAGYTVTAVEQ